MKIKTRIIILLVALFSVLGAADLGINSYLMKSSFQSLEERIEAGNNERIAEAFANDLSQLSSVCLDWASWDDMYAFIADRSGRFMTSNLNDDALKNNKLNALYCFDREGRVVWGESLDLASSEHIPCILPVSAEASRDSRLGLMIGKISSGDIKSGDGFMADGKNLILLSAYPILRSDHSGPVRGTLVMARTVTQQYKQRIEELTRNTFTLIGASGTNFSPDDTALPKGVSAAGSFLRRNGIRKDQYFTPVKGIDGNPVFYIMREGHGEILRTGLVSLRGAQISMLLSTLITSGILILLLYRWVIIPLTRLLGRIRNIKETGIFASDLPIMQQDEIGELTQEFNSLMHMTKHQTILLEEQSAQLSELARCDQLTGLSNRRRFDEALRSEWNRMKRERLPMSLLLLDIDHFKKFNDAYGHIRGDECLKEAAQVIQYAVRRPADIAARYGGEEFAVILPQTDEAGAMFVAEQILKGMKARSILHAGSPVGVVTFSIGAASLTPAADGPPTELVENADKALYKAKNEGRDRICLFV